MVKHKRLLLVFIVALVLLSLGLAVIPADAATEFVAAPFYKEQNLESLLLEQRLGPVFLTPVKQAIRQAVSSGVAVETIVLLLLLPVVAAFIAAVRHLIGLRGFGIFMPAALSVVFLAIGPVVGIGLFLVIVAASTFFRLFLRRLKLKLQYLPRMSLILWAVSVCVLGALFAAPYVPNLKIGEVSIFPVLILVLLSEEFARVQLGKSARVAISFTAETLVLALASLGVLSLTGLQKFALLNPEIVLLSCLAFGLFLGRYTGLRLAEVWRFRKLIKR